VFFNVCAEPFSGFHRSAVSEFFGIIFSDAGREISKEAKNDSKTNNKGKRYSNTLGGFDQIAATIYRYLPF
jgi:hypothetical protein